MHLRPYCIQPTNCLYSLNFLARTCKYIYIYIFHILHTIKEEYHYVYTSLFLHLINLKGAVGVVIHEIGHAIGFFHEQSRPDRDDYVTIHYENILEGLEDQFTKHSAEILKTNGIPYDYASIMHYGSHVSKCNPLQHKVCWDPCYMFLVLYNSIQALVPNMVSKILWAISFSYFREEKLH